MTDFDAFFYAYVQTSVMIQRRQNGVEPSMPTAAERDEILRAMQKMPY